MVYVSLLNPWRDNRGKPLLPPVQPIWAPCCASQFARFVVAATFTGHHRSTLVAFPRSALSSLAPSFAPLSPSLCARHSLLPTGPAVWELTAPRALTSSSSLQRLIVFLHLKLIFHVLSSLPILLHFHSPDYIDRDSSSSLIAFVRLSIIFSFLSSFFLIHYKLRCELVC